MPQSTTPGARVISVDLARALAVVMMIQGHTLNVLLAPTYRENSVFDAWVFVRVLTSCLFLFLSGFAFTLATTRHWEDFLRPSTRFWRRLRKFAFFLLLGYALHFPVYHLADFRFLSKDGWRGFLQVDVLQSIALTLIGLQLLVLVARTLRRLALLALAGAAIVVLLTPLVWAFPWADFMPLTLAAYLGAATGSPFPLFPWAAYVLAGAGLGYIYIARQRAPGALPFPALLLRLGALIGFSGLLFESVPFTLYANINFWKTSPNLFLIRLGCVLVLLAAIFAVGPFLRRLPRVVSSLAQESLTVYAVHLCVLYGSIWNLGLAQRIGPGLGAAETLGWIALLVVSMSLLAWGWNWSKKNQPPQSRVARAAVALALAYCLL
jgi:acyltransferase